MAAIKQRIAALTAGTLAADDKSMYRALRRYDDAELIEHTAVPNASGPDLKVYRLTTTGENILASFLERNIINVFYQPSVRTLIEKG